MTRDFVKRQLARLSAIWPTFPISSSTLDEWHRCVAWASETELSVGVSRLIDSYTEAAPPKPGHLVAAVKYLRGPEYFPGEIEEMLREQAAREASATLEEMEQWLTSSPEAQKCYREAVARLVANWPADWQERAEQAIGRSVLRLVYEAAHPAEAHPLRIAS